MSLPDLIEIVPLDKPVRAEITVPGSKSITNRALILAALADGEVTLEGALWSEDTQVMTEALLRLGFEIKVERDPDEFCNRRITVVGLGGKIPNTGTAEKPLELFVGNAGTAARFLAAMVCLGNGVYRLSGVPRMHERPQAALFKALRELGYRVDSENDKLPATIFGRAGLPVGQDARQRVPTKRACAVSVEESSQFASALLLSANYGGWSVKVVGENAEESPYVVMTTKLIHSFPRRGGRFQIEPDASSGSYFWGAGWLLPIQKDLLDNELNPILSVGELTLVLNALENKASLSDKRVLSVVVKHWPITHWQIDDSFPEILYEFSKHIEIVVSRKTNLADSIMTAIVLSPFFTTSSRFIEVGRLRLQECERVAALRTELTKCGAKVIEEGDTLTVYPSKLHGAEIETYNDHRMAMCFAILGLKVPGIKLKNPACVKKTFPNFFQKLTAPPPGGLGAKILDGRTGRLLEMNELFAE